MLCARAHAHCLGCFVCNVFLILCSQFVSMRKATLALDDVTACPTPPNPSSETSSSTAVLPPPPPSSSSLLLRTLEAGIKDERHDLLEVRGRMRGMRMDACLRELTVRHEAGLFGVRMELKLHLNHSPPPPTRVPLLLLLRRY